MRIHKALRIPELEYPAPFALGLSYSDTTKVVFTTSGNHQLRLVSWLLIGIALFGIIAGILVSMQSGLWFPVRTRYGGQLPVFATFPVGLACLALGIKLLRDANRSSQIVIDRHKHAAQIQYQRGQSTTTEQACITITQSELLNGPATGRRSKWNTHKQGAFHLVAIDVNHDCFILGAFHNPNSAASYAKEIQSITNLNVSNEHSAELKRVAGEKFYLFNNSDVYALKHRKSNKPMHPIKLKETS